MLCAGQVLCWIFLRRLLYLLPFRGGIARTHCFAALAAFLYASRSPALLRSLGCAEDGFARCTGYARYYASHDLQTGILLGSWVPFPLFFVAAFSSTAASAHALCTSLLSFAFLISAGLPLLLRIWRTRPRRCCTTALPLPLPRGGLYLVPRCGPSFLAFLFHLPSHTYVFPTLPLSSCLLSLWLLSFTWSLHCMDHSHSFLLSFSSIQPLGRYQHSRRHLRVCNTTHAQLFTGGASCCGRGRLFFCIFGA